MRKRDKIYSWIFFLEFENYSSYLYDRKISPKCLLKSLPCVTLR